MESPAQLMIDDRSSGTLAASDGNHWQLITDTVMGGVSTGTLTPDNIEGKACLRLRGRVALENNGGFVQAALNLGDRCNTVAAGYRGLRIEVRGNSETYNLHLRNDATRRPWQSYRAHFEGLPRWHTVQLPFSDFQPHRIDTPLQLETLRRLGVVAIGRPFTVDLCIGRLAFYR